MLTVTWQRLPPLVFLALVYKPATPDLMISHSNKSGLVYQFDITQVFTGSLIYTPEQTKTS